MFLIIGLVVAFGAIFGNLGPSYRQRGRTVQDILFSAPAHKLAWDSLFGNSVRLGLLSLAFAVCLGLPLGIAGIVLLIACANIVTLLMARGETRRREIATRLALGGTPGRIVRQMFAESLLVAFLSELVYLQEHEGLAFDQIDIQISGHRLAAELGGAKVGSIDKSIKAVTWHNLKIENTARGLEVEIVFDV